MPAIQCPGCHAHVPPRSHCPRCAVALPAAPDPTQPAAAPFPVRTWFNLACAGALLVLVVLIGYRMLVPSAAQQQQRQVAVALYACQQAVQVHAPTRAAGLPPFTRNFGSAGEFYFAWSGGSYLVPDRAGALVPLSASCIGDLASGTIRQLTVNGAAIE